MKRTFWWLGALLVVGCSIPPNTAPIALGVPDGFVLERELINLRGNDAQRVERVTFASQGERRKAIVVTPIRAKALPAAIILGRDLDWAIHISARERVVVMTDEADARYAVKKLAGYLEEVDPTKIEEIQ